MPFDQIHQSAVRESDTFRFSSRARGVDDVSQIVGHDSSNRIFRLFLRDRFPIVIQANQTSVRAVKLLAQVLLSHEHGRLRVLKHEQ